MSDYKKINLSFLESFTKNDSGKMVKYMSMFLQLAPGAIQTMKDQHAAGDWVNLRTTAHSLKPQIAYMGMESLKEPILRIEEYARDGSDPVVIGELISTVENGCSEAFAELNEAIRKLS